jgi:hypothetical protein
MRCSEPLARYEMTSSQHVYEIRPRQNHRGVDLISDALPFGRLWYDGPNAASHYSRSHDVVIRVYDAAGNVDRNARARGRVQRVVTFLLALRRAALMILLAALTRRDRISQINPTLFVLCAVRRACICTWRRLHRRDTGLCHT